MKLLDPRQLLRDMFDAAVAAALTNVNDFRVIVIDGRPTGDQ